MFGFGKKDSTVKPTGKATPALSDEEMDKLDFIVVVDHSGSMGARSKYMSGSRLDEVQESVMAMAIVAEKHDDDGLTVIAFDHRIKTYDGVGSLKVAVVFKEFPPDGRTNLTGALAAAVDKARESEKEVVVLVYTDGRPNNQDSAMDVIDQAGRTLGRPKIGLTLIQVGDDPGATRFLKVLDDEMKVDITATLSAQDAQGLTLHQLAWLARNA